MALETKIKNFVRELIDSSIIHPNSLSKKLLDNNVSDKYKWYLNLDKESQKHFWDLMSNARNEALYNVFCLLDGSLILGDSSDFLDFELLADEENIGTVLSAEYHTILEEEFPELYKLFVLGK